jgi:hypothetical protein
MTSKIEKNNHLTYLIDCKGKASLLLLSQIRTFDSKCLYRIIERIGKDTFDDIKKRESV